MIVEYSVGQFLAWLIRAHYLIIHRQFGTLTANRGFPWKRMEKLIRAVRGVESVTLLATLSGHDHYSAVAAKSEISRLFLWTARDHL